jgi:hypothetical protein
LSVVEAYLRGGKLVRKEDGSYEVIQVKNAVPLMNERGIREFLRIMRMRLDQKTYSLSNLNTDFISFETYVFNINLIEILAMKAREWEFRRENYHETIDALTSAFEATLRKGFNAITLRAIFEGGVLQQQQNKPRLLPW